MLEEYKSTYIKTNHVERKVLKYELSSDAVFVVCSQTFTLFRLRKTAVPAEISRYSFRVFVCACRFVFFPWKINDAIQYINPGYGVQTPKIVIL